MSKNLISWRPSWIEKWQHWFSDSQDPKFSKNIEFSFSPKNPTEKHKELDYQVVNTLKRKFAVIDYSIMFGTNNCFTLCLLASHSTFNSFFFTENLIKREKIFVTQKQVWNIKIKNTTALSRDLGLKENSSSRFLSTG